MLRNFMKLKVQDIETVVTMDEVLAELAIYWDQTGLSYVPVSEWTMEKKVPKWTKSQIQYEGKKYMCCLSILNV